MSMSVDERYGAYVARTRERGIPMKGAGCRRLTVGVLGEGRGWNSTHEREKEGDGRHDRLLAK